MKASISVAVSPVSVPPAGSLHSLPKLARRSISFQMHLRVDAEDARTGAMLVERAVAQFVEHRAFGGAFHQAEGV